MTLNVIKCDCHLSKVFWKRNIGGVSPWGRGAWIVELQPLLVVAYLPVLCDLFFVTPQTVAHWPLCPWDFPGKNTGRIAFPFSRGSSQPRNRNHVSSVSYICRQILYLWATRDTPPGVYDKTKNVFKKNTLVRASNWSPTMFTQNPDSIICPYHWQTIYVSTRWVLTNLVLFNLCNLTC